MTPNSCAFSRLPTPTFTQYSFRQAAPFPILTKHMAIDGPLKIDREPGKAPGSMILRLTGPLTLRNIFDLQAEMRKDEPRRVTAGVSRPTLELFKMTKVDAVLRMVPTLEDAEAIA